MSYIDENKLMAELEAADKAGDTAHAQMVADQINFQRNVLQKYGQETGMQIINAQDGGQGIKVADQMSGLDKFGAGMGRGFVDIGQGINQLGMRAGDAVGLVDTADVQNYDQKIAQEAQRFEKDLGDSTSATIGRITGQAAATAPAGMMAGRALAGATGVNNLQNASRLATAGRMGAHGAGIGAVEGALQPVLNGAGDFWSNKAVDTGIGAATGGILGGGTGALKAGAEIADQGVTNTLYQGISNPTENKILKNIVGDRAESEANKAAAKRLGDESMLTVAERSGSKGAQMLENLAEQSLFTADDVLEKSTIPKLNKFKDSVLKQADNLSKSNLSPEQMGVKIQQLTNSAGRQLKSQRAANARANYGKITDAAKGRKIVTLDSTFAAIDDITKKHSLKLTGDAKKIVNLGQTLKNKIGQLNAPKPRDYSYSQSMKTTVDAPAEVINAVTPSQALQIMQEFTSTKGNLFQDVSKSLDMSLKKQMRDAVLADMDNVGGGLGDMLRQANNQYRKDSEGIEALGLSILGRTAGKELSSNIEGMVANAIAPEKVVDAFTTAKPSQVASAMKYMDKFDPQTARDFQAFYLRNAVEEAAHQAASAGATEAINPALLMRSLGIKSGKAGVEGTKKLKSIFSGVDGGEQLIDDIIRIGRIKADSFGRNFSGTAATNQANQFIGALGSLWGLVTGSAQKAAGTLGHYAGIKGVARALTDDMASWQPTRLNWSGNRTSNGLALGGAFAVPQAVQSQRNDN